jgi:hypothetical protein
MTYLAPSIIHCTVSIFDMYTSPSSDPVSLSGDWGSRLNI